MFAEQKGKKKCFIVKRKLNKEKANCGTEFDK